MQNAKIKNTCNISIFFIEFFNFIFPKCSIFKIMHYICKKFMYKVSLNEPISGKYDYYFGSLSAIFAKFTPEQIGCGLRQLWNFKISEENPYVGGKCTITKEVLIRKKQANKQ